MTENTINLAWSNNATNGTGVVIQRGTGLYTQTQLTTVSGTSTSYSDTSCSPGTTYFYSLYTTSLNGDSKPCPSVSTTTNIFAPSELTATASDTLEDTISLTWTNNSANTNFNLERSPDGSTWTLLATPTGTSYTDSTCIGGTEYFYRIQTIGTNVNSAWSNTANATTVIDAPTDLTATDNGETEIDLTWTNNSSDEAGFKIERSPDGSTWTLLATVGTVTSYSDTGLAGLATWYYRVRAFKGSIYSGYSDTADASTTFPAPSSLIATVNGSTEIDLAFTVNSVTQTSFDLERSTDGTNFSTLTSVSSTATTYHDTGLEDGTEYWYKIRAVNGNGDTSFSNTADAQTLLYAPSGLTISGGATEIELDLEWTINSSSQTHVLVEKSTDGTNFSQIASLGSSATTYSDTADSGATQYWYRVRVENTEIDSPYSNVATGTTILNAPSGLGATGGSDQIVLAWTNNSAAATNVAIERSPDNSTWTQIATVSNSTDTYTNSGLTENETFYYRVRCYKNSVYSNYSSAASATTILYAPSGLTAGETNETHVALNWTVNSSAATSQNIQRSTDGVSWSTVTSVSNSTHTYTDNYSFAADTTYYYRIQAVDGGTTANSNTASLMLVPNIPGAPTVGDYTTSSIPLSWTNNSSIATGFTIEQSTDLLTWTTAGTSSTNSTTLTDTYGEGEVLYERVAATTTDTTSGYSGYAEITMPPAAPTDLASTYNSSGNLIITWQNNSAHDDTYWLEWTNLYYSAVHHTVQLDPDTTVGDEMTYSSLSPTTSPEGQIYDVSVWCSENGVDSAVDGPISIQSAPYAPVNLNYSIDDSGNVILTWTNISTTYIQLYIYQSFTSPSDFSDQIGNAPPPAATYTISGIAPGQTVYFMLVAMNSSGVYATPAAIVVNT